jgi:RHS repeat-associated protein
VKGVRNQIGFMANEYTTVCGTTVQYDNAGNLTLDKSGYVYNYDYENRLVNILKNGQLKASFEYDALGRRIEKVITGSPTTTTRYYYDDQRIVLQTSVSGVTETDEKYFIFGNYIDEVLLMHNLAGTYTGDFYYGHDHLYSPTVLFGLNEQQSWVPVERYEYDVYGTCRIMTSGYNLLSSSAYGNPYTFTGRELDSFDSNTFKIMYYRARSYDPQTGRFLQRDPLGVNPAGGTQNPYSVQKQYSDGMNLYEYVKNNSLRYRDMYGLECGVIQYREPGLFGHAGLLVDGAIIDFGPEWPCIVCGQSPFGSGPSDKAKQTELKKSEVGLMNGWNGKGHVGKPCKCATCEDVKACIRGVSKEWDSMPYFTYGINCRTFVDAAKRQCCLR